MRHEARIGEAGRHASSAERYARQQEVVAQLGLRALVGVEFRALMQEAADAIARTLDVEFASVLQVQPDGGLFLLAGVGWSPGYVGTATLPTGERSQAGYTLLVGEPVVVADVATEQRFELASPLRDHAVGSGASVVIHGRDRPFGVLAAHSARTQAFTGDEVHFLQSVANLIGAVIERRSVEDELRERQRQLAEAQRIARLGSWFWDIERDEFAWSDELSRIYGFGPTSPLTYERFLDTVHPEDSGLVRDSIERALREGGSFEVEHRIVRPDGGVRILHARGGVSLGPEGRPIRLAGTAQDITERKEFEAHLAERDRLQQMLDVLPVGVEVIDTAGRAVLRNRMTFEILGEPRSAGLESAIGAYEMFRPDGSRYERAELPLARALGGETVRAEQIVIRGTPRELDVVLLVNSAPLRAADGTVVAAMSVFQDITELAELARQRAEFFAIASHEIKQPATAIRGLLQLAKRGQAPKDERKFLDRLAVQVDRMIAIVDDLLGASRLVVRDPAAKWERVDLAAIARESATRAGAMSDRHTIKVRAPSDPVWVAADGDDLRTVIDNLAGNAVKYSPGGGPVEISVAIEEESTRPTVVVQVRDRGIGVLEADRDHIFEPFYRSRAVRELSGTGLGLYICRQILQRRGGRIWLAETSDEGSTFAVALPIERRAAPRA